MNEEDIFLAALDLEGRAERDDYLERACGKNLPLRRRVETLLASFDDRGNFLQAPALEQFSADETLGPAAALFALAGPLGTVDDSVLKALAPSESPGSLGRLGRFEVEEVVGRGSCGVVLRARDPKLNRVVAIKALAPELAASKTARQRFLREASAAASLAHDRVVRVFEVEESPFPYLVMEFVSGETLQKRVDRLGPLDVKNLLAIAIQIADGLAAAHAQGLVHRDVKPCNILLSREGRDARIVDFGLARSVDDASLTYPGFIAGTPRYMSPEQAESRPIDARSDLFSLGSVLYFMASGRPPFDGSSSLAAMRDVVEKRPASLTEIVPGVPSCFAGIVAKLLEKRPEDRFQSAEEVRDALAQCLERPDEIVSFGDASPGIERRGRAYALAIVAPILFALAGLGLAEGFGWTNFAGIVIRVFFPEGTLVIETDDPKIVVRIDGERVVLTGTGVDEISLKPGKYEVVADKNGEVVRRDVVEVVANDRRVVSVRLEPKPNDVAAAAPDAPVMPPPNDKPAEDTPADDSATDDSAAESQAKRLAELFDRPTVWKGTRTYRRDLFAGVTVPYFLHFRRRDDDKLGGDKFDNGPHKNFAVVTGHIDGTKVVWHEQAPRGDSFDIEAELVGDELRLTFSGTYPNGAPTSGDGVLKLEAPPP